jgi:hypothetical protein
MNLDKISKTALKKAGYKSISDRVRYRSDIGAFAEEVLGLTLAPYQREILSTFLITHRVAVRAPRGAGKTTMSAIIILWAVSVFDTDVKVITTASAWRQLTRYTWPEVHKLARKADWDKVGVQVRDGIELTALTFKIQDRQAFAAASDTPSSIEGAHASIVIVVFDEAKAIPPSLWDAMEGTFSTGKAYAFAISTPGVPSGRFYDIHQRRKGFEDWNVRHVTLAECIAAGRFQQRWAEDRLAQWGASSAAYQNYVLANFSESSEDVVIPLSWIEAANERWLTCGGTGEGPETWGVDPGYKGNDPTVTARLVGNVIEQLESRPKQDLMATVGRVTAKVAKVTPVGVDIIGVGAGVYSRLAELGYAAKPVNVSMKCEFHDRTGQNSFINLRSYIWWSLREALDPSLDIKLALPPDDNLTGDLSTPTWEYKSNGVIQVESKKDIRERLDRSTDSADAVGLAWYVAAHRGLSPEDVQKIATGNINVEGLSEGLLAFMKTSGVNVEELKESLHD